VLGERENEVKARMEPTGDHRTRSANERTDRSRRRRRDERRDSAETLGERHRASRERKKKKNDRLIDRSIQLSPLDAARPAVTPTDLTHTPRHRASGGCRADNRDDADVESRIIFQRG